MYPGKIIVLEGPDATGKKTQTRILVQSLIDAGYMIKTMAFPRYETPTGQKVRAYLDGKYGNLKDLDPKVVSRLYAEDRLAAKPEIMAWLEKGGIWVFDRYMESNMAHQGAKFKDQKQKVEMIKWLTDLECGEMSLPESDLVIYLSLPLKYMIEGMEQDKRVKDLHEGNMEHMISAKETYDILSKRSNWMTVQCVPPGAWTRYTIEEISERISETAKTFLRKNYVSSEDNSAKVEA